MACCSSAACCFSCSSAICCLYQPNVSGANCFLSSFSPLPPPLPDRPEGMIPPPPIRAFLASAASRIFWFSASIAASGPLRSSATLPPKFGMLKTLRSQPANSRRAPMTRSMIFSTPSRIHVLNLLMDWNSCVEENHRAKSFTHCTTALKPFTATSNAFFSTPHSTLAKSLTAAHASSTMRRKSSELL